MIKGVNKQIIEINDLENKIFEKAVLYIRPEYSEASIGKLHNSAKEFVNKATEWDLWCVETETEENSDNDNKKKITLSLIGTGLLVLGVIFVLLVVL